MAKSRGFFRRKGPSGPGAIDPIRVGDVLPAAPEQSAQQVADRVRAIVDAAERNAVEIERFAHADAERIRAEAVAEGQAHIERVRASTQAIERRAAALEEAMGEIISGLGRGAAQLDRDLGELSTDLVAPAPAELEPAVDDGQTHASDDPAASADAVDLEGARLVALNLAFDGASREDAAAQLAEHYPGMDAEALLHEIYEEFGDAETPADAPS